MPSAGNISLKRWIWPQTATPPNGQLCTVLSRP
nr:MAG TPA: hypothetical protein [Caudoviricetes sp.]DAQ96258.1 MAG TPA: hypothetical protein [Caudoviricetes sp.]